MKEYVMPLVFSLIFIQQGTQKYNFVFTGNSIFANNPAYSIWGGESPVYKTVNMLKKVGYDMRDTNIAVSGYFIVSIINQMDTIDKYVRAGYENIFICNEFHNSAGSENIRGESIADKVFQIVRQVKSKGFQKVYWLTPHVVDYKNPQLINYQYDSINPKRITFSRILKDSALSVGYNVIDISANNNFDDSSDCSKMDIYRDRLHLRGELLGAKMYADIMFNAINQSLCNKSATRILEQEPFDNILISPNPVLNVLQFSDYCSYELYDILGNVLKKDKGTTIDMANLPNGIYFIRVNQKITLKLVKV
jgi:hypothetical protein